jgi:hypothetical protein
MQPSKIWGECPALAVALMGCSALGCADSSSTNPFGSAGAAATAGATGDGQAASTGDDDPAPPPDPDDDGASTGRGSDGTTGTDADGSTSGSSGPELPSFEGLIDLGSLVILGDSIGDGGGQGPYYYALLRASLEQHYGPIEYRNNADGGSETDALPGQVSDLPSVLPGPVAVVITSGGNDMKDDIGSVILGTDGPHRAQMKANIDAALGALTTPGRFGPGVEVYVFEANIYDSSDGAGDFGQHDCAFGGGLPPIPTDPFFETWNADIRDAVEARGQIPVDMHGYFYGHGYASGDNWYASDCTHPNSDGHDELHRFVFEIITGT